MGAYGQQETEIMVKINNCQTEKRMPDQNIKNYLRTTLPKDLSKTSIIDWGTGVGRFVNLYIERGSPEILLIEPSNESFNILKSNFSKYKQIRLINKNFDEVNECETSHGSNIHISTFAINCTPSLDQSLGKILVKAKKDSKIIVVTNLFVPTELLANHLFTDPDNFMELSLSDLKKDKNPKPILKEFRNQIISENLILKDIVHTLSELNETLTKHEEKIIIQSIKLFEPDGFQIIENDERLFGNRIFKVCAIEIQIRTDV